MLWLWIKAFHLIFAIAWFAGIFYLPRLFVYHTTTNDVIGNTRFKLMEKKLFFAIMTPAAFGTLFFGSYLVIVRGVEHYHGAIWLYLKLALVLCLVGYHVMCYRYLCDFRNDCNRHSALFYRWFNEVPVVILILVVILAVVRPV